jgi:hypothetical protein
MDLFVSTFVSPTLSNQPWLNALKVDIRFPDKDTIIGLLGAVISGIAAIIGLLLSISLVVLQLAANRYPHSMIRFLVDEKVGAYIIDLLVTTFLFALWTLFLFNRTTVVPYISVFSCLVLATISVVFVFVYRTHGLYFFHPKQTFATASREAVRTIQAIFEKERKLGTSVTSYLQQKVQENVQLMSDFSEVLAEQKDSDFFQGVLALSSVLSFYVKGKRFVDPQSGWFPFVEMPVDSTKSMASIELSRPFEEFALGVRTERKPNSEWLERQIFQSLRKARKEAVGNDDRSCTAALIVGYKDIMDNCLQQQEFQILDVVLSELKDLGIQISTINHPEALNEFYNTALWLADKAIHGFDKEALSDALNKLSWFSDEEILSLKLPRIFNEELLSYRRKLETEIAAEKRILTPKNRMEKEINGVVEKIDQEISRKYYTEVFGILSNVYAKVMADGTLDQVRNVVVAELLQLRRAGVRNRESLVLMNIDTTLKQAQDAYAILEKRKDLRHDVFKELKLACLNSIKSRESGSFDRFFGALVWSCSEEVKKGKDHFPEEALESIMVVGALAFLDSEFSQDKKPFSTVVETLPIYFDMGKLFKAFKTLLQSPRLIYEYHHWFKDLLLKISAMPTVTKARGESRGLDIVYDHPSEFIQRAHHIGITECVEGMVDKLAKLKKKQSAETR